LFRDIKNINSMLPARRFVPALLAAVATVASRSSLCGAWVVPSSSLSTSAARRCASDNSSPRDRAVLDSTKVGRHPSTPRQSLRAAAGASNDDATDGTQTSAWISQWNRAVTTCVATAALWTFVPNVVVDNMPASTAAIASSIPQVHLQSSAAHAKEMASGSGSRVNKDAESLLRYGLPIQNKEVSAMAWEACVQRERGWLEFLHAAGGFP
jgi:hypothetical protein